LHAGHLRFDGREELEHVRAAAGIAEAEEVAVDLADRNPAATLLVSGVPVQVHFRESWG
jgi:hypothetical protein